MIDWKKTNKQFGYSSCSNTKKVIVICQFCDNDITVTKNRFYQNRKRNGGLYRCLECSKQGLSDRTSRAIKNKWKDEEYQHKQKARRHSDQLKKQASDRSRKLWKSEEYRRKFHEGFDPDKARRSLEKARPKAIEAQSRNLKRKWKDQSYRSKMSMQSRQLWQDDEYRNKVIEGYKASLTDDVRKRMSDAAKSRWADPKYRENWLVSFLDSFTDERRREIGLRSAKLWATDEYRSKIQDYWDEDKRQWMAQVCREWWTDDRKAQISELMIERWSDPEWRNKCIKAFIDSWKSPERRKAAKDWWTPERRKEAKDWWTPERRKEAGERSRLLWKDPEYVQKFLDLLGRPSSLEQQFANMLSDYDVEYEQQVHIGPYLFDFQVGNKLIEIQGDYWHRLDRTVAKDKAKGTYIERYFPDLSLLYIWEHEFYEVEKVKYFIESFLVDSIDVVDYSFDDVVIDADVPKDDARCLFEKYHYKSGLGRGGLIIGARVGGILVACCVFASPTRNVEGGELTRFVIHPRYRKKNLASWFLSRASKFGLDKFGSLFTFADPNFNHHGAIYLASNWSYVGDAKPDYWYVDRRGWVIHKKTLWNRARNLCMKESEFAGEFGYSKVWGLPKKKFVLNRP